LGDTSEEARVIDARKLAQIGIFLVGIFHLNAILFAGPVIVGELFSERETDLSFVLVYVGQLVFVLTLLFGSGGWAKLVSVPGTVSSFSSLSREDLFLVAVSCLGLLLLVTGIADVVGSTVEWFQQRRFALGPGALSPYSFPSHLEVVPVIRAALGLVLVLWGTSVVELIRWARGLGRQKGVA
jgi:hypothetical protein